MPGKYLTVDQRNFIVIKMEDGYPVDLVVKQFRKKYSRTIDRVTAYRTYQRYKERGTTEDKEKTGSPPIYNDREKKVMQRESLKRPEESLRDLQKDSTFNPKKASKDTLNRLLLSVDIFTKALSPRYFVLGKKQIIQRRAFARTHLNWTQADWELAIFTDESDLFPTKCGRRFYRFKWHEGQPSPANLTKEIKQNIKIKVWGAISCFGVGPLIRYKKTLKQDIYLVILKNFLMKEYPQLEGGAFFDSEDLPAFIFVDDNAPPHRGNLVQKWKNENGIKSLKWPSKSPDINIIENVWAYLQDKLYEISDKLRSPDDTWREAKKIWYDIPTT